MTEVDEKITSEPEEAQEVEEINQLNAEEIPEEILLEVETRLHNI